VKVPEKLLPGRDDREDDDEDPELTGNLVEPPPPGSR
jgi:hypothetical protein